MVIPRKTGVIGSRIFSLREFYSMKKARFTDTSGLGMITALSLLEQGLRHLTLPIAYVRADGFFENKS